MLICPENLKPNKKNRAISAGKEAELVRIMYLFLTFSKNPMEWGRLDKQLI